MHIPPWLTLLLSLPVLLLGEQLQQRIAVLSRYHIPAPVIGGLLVALVIGALGYYSLQF
ncbi:MAG: sodium/glutamate symporter, partial [Polyangiales bacterium]